MVVRTVDGGAFGATPEIWEEKPLIYEGVFSGRNCLLFIIPLSYCYIICLYFTLLFLYIPLLLFAMECTVLVRYLCMTDAFLPCAVIFYSDGNNCCRASEYFTFIDADRYFIIYINICM